jgi:rRNA-processing protein FCF1
MVLFGTFSVILICLYNVVRLSYRIAKDPRFKRLACTHKGTYADDCIVERVTQVKVDLLKSFFYSVPV